MFINESIFTPQEIKYVNEIEELHIETITKLNSVAIWAIFHHTRFHSNVVAKLLYTKIKLL